MDEHQIGLQNDPNSDATPVQSEAVASQPAPVKQPQGNPLVAPLICVVFAAVTLLFFLIAKRADTLTTDAQQFLYPLFAGLLMGGVTVIWLTSQILDTKRRQEEAKPWVFPVLGGALTLLLMVTAYIGIGMWPVGEKSAMIVDMHHQYAPMLSQLRDMILNGGSPLYSFEVGTGTSFIPLFAYYLASPFNLLLLLFPKAFMAEGILVITLLKMMLTGAFMTLCIQYIYKRRNFSTVIVGVMYALMMYMIAYSWDIMWLDCVMCLPLVVMGFEHMMRTGKYLLYVLSLAYSLYANYYIGFMICVFMVLYYLVFLVRAPRSSKKQTIGFARFAIGSALGGGLAMFILLPAFSSLSSTSASSGSLMDQIFDLFSNFLQTNFDVFELFNRGLYGVEPTVRSGNLPNVYCGLLAVVALPLFATMSSIPLRRRMAYLGLLFFMTLSLVFTKLDLVWHGFHSPNDLPYRYSFIFSFVMLLITADVLYRIRDIKPIQIAITVLGLSAYLIVEEHFGTEDISLESIYISFLLIAVYGVIMLLVAQRKLVMRAAYAALLVVVTAELLFNASSTFEMLNNNEHYTAHDSYLDNDVTKAVQATVDQMETIGDEAANGDFYRMEFLPRRTTADTAMFDYRGITVFASSGSYNMTRFMGSIGYDVNGVNSQLYQSVVPTSDALLGIKYVAKESYVAEHPQLVNLGQEVSVGDSKYRLYENPYALPLGFMVKNDVKNFHSADAFYEPGVDESCYYNVFGVTNKLYKTMTGTSEDVYKMVPVRSLNDTVASVSEDRKFSIHAANTAVFTAAIDTADEYYIYVDCRAAKSINVSAVDRNWGVTTYQPYIIDAGHLEPGAEVTVTITSDIACQGNIYVMSLNKEVFERDVEILKKNTMKVDRFDDSSIHGTIHVDEAGVMCTSIEYDKGWTVKVDGKKVEPLALNGALLALDLEAGDHEISMSFMPSGLLPGIFLSVISLILLVLLLLYLRARDNGKPMFDFSSKNQAVKESDAQ